MNPLAEHLRFYEELGVTGVSRDPRWRRRDAGPARQDARPEGTATDRTADPLDAAPDGITAAADSLTGEPVPLIRSIAEVLADIRIDIGECTRCKLHTLGRRQIVFGTGSSTAEIMFVGEAPGADEDEQGVPFVGRAGQLLTKMIEAMGLRRDEVYIANVLKCRPPGNRNPEPDEIQTCQPFLFRQIASIEPKVVIALGAFAARTLLDTAEPISKLRGRIFDFRGAKLIPTFHPSYLLRSPGNKREAWEDLKTALGVLGRQAPATGPSAPAE